MLPRAVKRLPLLSKIVPLVIEAEAWCFDRWHKVDTAMDDRRPTHDSINLPYQPTRGAKLRAILRELPISDFSRYCFVDFGSGKGRMLLIAGQLPFKTVQGVELRRELHEKAMENISRCRRLRWRSPRIESTCVNATEFTFPDSPLVLYFFNPFGREVMQQVMSALKDSLQVHPRDAFLAMLNPACASVVESVPGIELYREGVDYRIYRRYGSEGEKS